MSNLCAVMMLKTQQVQKINTKYSDYKKFDLKGKKLAYPKSIIEGLNEEKKKSLINVIIFLKTVVQN